MSTTPERSAPAGAPSPVGRLPGLQAWAAAVFVGLGLLLAFAALLVSLRLEKALTDLVEARAALIARQVADTVEGGLRFGVALADQTETPRRLQALAQRDPELLLLAVLDEQGRPLVRQTVLASPPGLAGRPVERLLARRPGASAEPVRKVWRDGRHIHVLLPVRDASGLPLGAVWVLYAADGPQAAFEESLRHLGLWAAGLTVVGTLLLTGLLGLLSRRLEPAVAAAGVAPVARWPVLPVPQALGTLSRLEAELALQVPPAPPATPGGRP
jgi:hypothetical protein